MNLQKLFETARDNAKRIFDTDHSIMPIWHAISANDENLIIATPWSSDEEKDGAILALRDFFREKNVLRFAFVCEAWMTMLNPDETKRATATGDFPRASSHPDRREVIRITAEDRDGTVLSGQFFILRPEHGPPTLSPFHQENFEHFEGRLTGLLTTEKRRTH